MGLLNIAEYKFLKFRGLSLKDKLLFLSYSVYYVIFLFWFRILGYKKTRIIIDKISCKEGRNNSFKKGFIESRSKIIGNVTVNSPFNSTCLERSLFTYLIFRIYRIETEIKFGVNNLTEEFSAHSWVEYKGLILNDNPELIENISPF